uniref:Centromere protein J C-terminal domain-containing protein n=2 Tax=Amphimedon queenslandica TaxID=400682 RepID=A0A1X7V3K4_AMPQE
MSVIFNLMIGNENENAKDGHRWSIFRSARLLFNELKAFEASINSKPSTSSDSMILRMVKSFSDEEDGSKVLLYSNGTKKVVSPNGLTSTMYFFNGDIKRTQEDGDVIYYYSSSQTTHTTKPDGTEIIKFKNGQSETHHRNGSKDIVFPDGTIRHVLPSGEEKIKFSDGVTQRVLTNGDKIIDFPDGQRETHTSLYKRREYPDGTVKTVYQDGRQETQYANGRLRIKDPDGRVILDRLPTVSPPVKATPHLFSQPS